LTNISGQIQGIETGMKAVVDFGAQKDDLMRSLERQNAAVCHCLNACMSSLSSGTPTACGTVKYARAFDDSRQLIGTIGSVQPGPVNTIDVIIAQDRARQMGGKIEGGIALSFMNEPLANGSGRGAASSSLPVPHMPS
jgi:hypothetical protein